MKKKKPAKIKQPRNVWEINPRSRIHSNVGYTKKDRNDNKNIDNINDYKGE